MSHDIDGDPISWSRFSYHIIHMYWLNQWITWVESKTNYRFRLKLMGTHVSGRYYYTVFIAVIRKSRFANGMQKVKIAFASPFETWKFQNRPSCQVVLKTDFCLPGTGRPPARGPGILPCFVTCRSHMYNQSIITASIPKGQPRHRLCPISFLHVLTMRSPSLLVGEVPLLNEANWTPN